MPYETRTFAEGSLRWANASATGMGWVTAAAATTALVGFVQAGFQAPSAARVQTIMDRGNPSHHKQIGREPGEITFTFLEAITANNPGVNKTTAGGASVPLKHFELKSTATEDGAGLWYQFHHCALISDNFTEAEEGNNRQQTWRYLSMTGPTASGYLT